MKFKYVKEFEFPADRGFRGSNKMPARAGKAVGAPRMESMPKVGKAQGYAEGGSVKKLARGGIPNDMMSPAQRALPVRQRDFYRPRDYLVNPDRMPTEQEWFDRARIRADERAKRAVRNKLAKDAARSAALKTVGKVAARAIPGLGAALTAYDVGKYAYNKYQQNQARKKPTVTVQQVPDSGAPPAPSRGGSSGGMGITSGGAMARGMPTSGLPAKRGSITVEETEDTGYKRGGSVKGKAKIAKVMREYKEGKLHSGSKKGPKVKSREQAVAIALSEARKAGAKIQKKAMGGSASAPREDFGRPIMEGVYQARANQAMKRGRRFANGGIFNDENMAYESKGPKTRGTARKGREQGRRERRAREAMERAEKYAPGLSLDMADRKKHGGMPVHRRKPMYGNG